MKKLRFALLALLLVLPSLLTSCTSSGDTSDTSDTDASADTTAEAAAAETTTEETTAAMTEAPKKELKTNPNDPDFYILYTDGEVDFTDAPKAYVDIYRWSEEYMPVTFAQIVFKEGDGFYVRMECEETDPRAVNKEYDGPIYEDSCVEFFAVYKPEINNKYVNIEMNANGAYLCYYCKSMSDNVKMHTLTDSMPTCTPFKTDTSWGVELHVPLKMIDDAYGGESLTLGDTILMNLYKCGNKTPIPHYGAWSDVELAKPNFHQPQFFSEVEIRLPD